MTTSEFTRTALEREAAPALAIALDDAGRLTLRTEAGPGWRAMTGWVETPHGPQLPSLAEPTGHAAPTTEALTWTWQYEALDIIERVRCVPQSDHSAILERRLENTSALPVTLSDVCFGKYEAHPSAPADGAPGPVFNENGIFDARIYHTDNVRTEQLPWTRPEYPCVKPLPRAPRWFGHQQSQPIPAMVLTNRHYTETLVQGQLDQTVTRMRWWLGAGPHALAESWHASWQFVGGSYVLKPGATLELEPMFLQVLFDTHPQDALSGYNRAVLARQPFPRQQQNVLRHQAVYGTWNYGLMRHIDERKLMTTARCVAEKLPDVRFFLIDGGWVNYPQRWRDPHLGDFHLDEHAIYNREKFPSGMKGVADQLRALGLRPALHWTPFVNLASHLAQDHPDWLARNAQGDPYRIRRCGYLDYSLPEVQDFLRHTMDTIAHKWGFEGIKIDFWSQSVEDDAMRFRHGGTGMQWRDWLLSTVRAALPADGFMMTGVATAMGNPFLGKHAETYRCCIDVGHCEHWRRHCWASSWVQPLLSQPDHEMILLSVDAVGVSKHLSDRENLHRLTYTFITQGSIEIDGQLEQLPDYQMDWLARLTAHMDRGYPVHCPDEQAFTGDPFPTILYVDYPSDSPTRQRGVQKHIALMNWSDSPRWIAATNEQLNLRQTTEAREFWTDAHITFEDGHICRLLPPHGAELWEVAG